MKDTIRIASGQGFWGDLPRAPSDQVRKGPIDYLVMDYLAEVTMSILQKQRSRNPAYGFARDFIERMEDLLPDIKSRKIRVVTNAGGVNPISCKNALLEIAARKNIRDLVVAVVDGDDILDRIDILLEGGHRFENMDTGQQLDEVKDRLLSANVYFGCRPIVEALEAGADIVITGRVTDASLILGPLVHEFGWAMDDYDKLASGTVAGHIIECGGQATGGNLTDWQSAGDLTDIGFPIIEALPDSSFTVTKHDGTGGLVNEMTVKEQLLYEIGDPFAYVTPDVTADFTTIKLRQVAPDKVEVKGVKGRAATSTYKVSASYHYGYKITASLVYCRPEAVRKALYASSMLQKRAEALGITFEDFRMDLIGINACSEKPPDIHQDADEVEMRISARGPDRIPLDRFGKEITPLILTGPGGVTGYAGGRPRSSEIVAYWPALLDKQACQPGITIYQS